MIFFQFLQYDSKNVPLLDRRKLGNEKFHKSHNSPVIFYYFRKLMDGLRCIDDFTLRCLDREHRAYFNTLYAGTTQVIVDLCQEGPYQSGTFTHCYKFSNSVNSNKFRPLFGLLRIHSNLDITKKSIRPFLFTILNNSLYQM